MAEEQKKVDNPTDMKKEDLKEVFSRVLKKLKNK